MKSEKKLVIFVSVVICGLIVTCGCEPAAESPELALKFAPAESATYRSVIKKEMSLKFEGSLKGDSNLKDGRNSNFAEIIFNQQTLNIDEDQNATFKITIQQLKVLSLHKNDPILDFDSTVQSDPDSPLAKIIGKSYTITVTPNGKVSKISDASEIRHATLGSSIASKTALGLLKDEAIKERHEVEALFSVAEKGKLKKGDSWKKTKTFKFPIVGGKSYERVYTLSQIDRASGQCIATIEMNAIPDSQEAEDLHKEAPASPFSKMFDETETYSGQLQLDLNTGTVNKYTEKLESEWIMVDPMASPDSNEPPDAVRMGAIRYNSLEKIN